MKTRMAYMLLDSVHRTGCAQNCVAPPVVVAAVGGAQHTAHKLYDFYLKMTVSPPQVHPVKVYLLGGLVRMTLYI